MLKYWEEKTAGIIIKKIKGLVIPPVIKNNSPSWIISNPKYMVDNELFNWLLLTLYFK